MNAFGAFQTYYVDFFCRPDSDISWIGSIQIFLTWSMRTFSGRLTDAGYFRSVFCEYYFTILPLIPTSPENIFPGFLSGIDCEEIWR